MLKQKNLARLVRCPSLLERPNDDIKTRFAEGEITFQESQVRIFNIVRLMCTRASEYEEDSITSSICPFQRQSYLQRKELEVKRCLNAIIKGKQKEGCDVEAASTDRDRLISSEIEKIQSVSFGKYVNTLTGASQYFD